MVQERATTQGMFCETDFMKRDAAKVRVISRKESCPVILSALLFIFYI